MINWKVRFKNKRFVIAFIAGLLLLVKQVSVLFGYNLNTGMFNTNINGIVDTVFLILGFVNVNVKIYKKDKIKLYNQSKLVSRFKKCFIF